MTRPKITPDQIKDLFNYQINSAVSAGTAAIAQNANIAAYATSAGNAVSASFVPAEGIIGDLGIEVPVNLGVWNSTTTYKDGDNVIFFSSFPGNAGGLPPGGYYGVQTEFAIYKCINSTSTNVKPISDSSDWDEVEESEIQDIHLLNDQVIYYPPLTNGYFYQNIEITNKAIFVNGATPEYVDRFIKNSAGIPLTLQARYAVTNTFITVRDGIFGGTSQRYNGHKLSLDTTHWSAQLNTNQFFRANIGNFNWSGATNYSNNDYVIYNNILYKCVSLTSLGKVPATNSDWVKIYDNKISGSIQDKTYGSGHNIQSIKNTIARKTLCESRLALWNGVEYYDVTVGESDHAKNADNATRLNGGQLLRSNYTSVYPLSEGSIPITHANDNDYRLASISEVIKSVVNKPYLFYWGRSFTYSHDGHLRYFDVFPPYYQGISYTMADFKTLLPSISYIRFSGDVDGNDILRCEWTQMVDRIRVYVQNSEQRSDSAANWVSFWGYKG